jgi:hypothetical protein
MYRLIQKRRAIIWEIIISIIVRKKGNTDKCLILNCYREKAFSIYKYISSVNGNREKDKLPTVNLILILIHFLNGQFVTQKWRNFLQYRINARKSHRQPRCTLQLVREDCVLFVWDDLHVSLSRQQRLSASQQILWCINLPSVSFDLLPTPRKKSNRFRYGDLNSSIFVTI